MSGKAKTPRPRRKATHKPYADFMVRAYVMEAEARERYSEFADQMEVHNNPEVAQLFRKLAQIEGLHADRIVEEMGWGAPPQASGLKWDDMDSPEAAPVTELHYLMQPYHALQLALRCEQRAERFFARIARSKVPAEVRRVAAEMAGEEREHVRLIRHWLKKTPKPEPGWDRDLDPPTYAE